MSTSQAVTDPIRATRLPGWDGIRALAATSVLVLHSAVFRLGDRPALQDFVAQLQFGVQVFFVVSNFVVALPFVIAVLAPAGARPRRTRGRGGDAHDRVRRPAVSLRPAPAGGAARDRRLLRRGRPSPERGTVFVVGDCAATYFSDGQAWRPLEAGAAGGGDPLRVWFPGAPDAPDAARQPLVVREEEGSGQFVGVRYLPGHRIQLGCSSPETGGAWIDGAAIRVEPGIEHEVTVMFDSPL